MKLRTIAFGTMGACLFLGSAMFAACVGDSPATSDTTPPTPEAGSTPDSSSPGDAGLADTSATYRDLVLEDRPVLYLRLGEPTGASVAYDEIEAGTTATYQRVSSASGALLSDPNTAAAFASGSLISITSLPDFAAQEHFSIEAWIKPESLLADASAYAHVLTGVKIDGSGLRQGYGLFIGNTTYGFGVERFVDDKNVKAVVATPPPTTRFSHVVATYDGMTLTVYTDGIAGPSNTDTRPLKSAVVLPGFVGGASAASPDFVGVLDEIAVYDHALTPERVHAHYMKGTTGQ